MTLPRTHAPTVSDPLSSTFVALFPSRASTSPISCRLTSAPLPSASRLRSRARVLTAPSCSLVWEMAHWTFLRRLAGGLLARQPDAAQVIQQGETGQQGVAVGAVELPAFIPGIIIQGHDWHLTLTTIDAKQTVFWQKVSIGSTSSSKGVYQIICILQVLRKWVGEYYWPWLRGVILKREHPESSLSTADAVAAVQQGEPTIEKSMNC